MGNGKQELPKQPPPIKGDPDFAGVARERVSGPADYDESAGNELQPQQDERGDADVASDSAGEDQRASR